MKRIGVVGIVIEGNRDVAMEVQKILSENGDIILGRMGIPDREDNISAISLIVKGESERISALTGKLGRLERVNVKSALTSVETD
ncbi:MAG: CopG family transcriptional regulator [Faecalibacterium sp.]|nr:CopG family transcriptional regulator [Faecalibacterium sp.]MDY3256670.1 TM1266 family iron-only hydrogenase system putative regulator [Eubacteriales bacterium]